MARLTFHGAAGEVTGSCHLLNTEAANILLECGLHQGNRDDEARNEASFPFDPAALDAVVLSHGHLDHSGRLPRLVRAGYGGPVYCTPQTRDLLRIMLRDAAFLQLRDIEWENKRRQRAGRELLEPLYTQEDVDQTLEQCIPVELDGAVEIAPGVALRFHDAGHIIGSAAVELTLTGRDGARRLVFSGDIGNPNTLLMPDPQVPEAADWVIMESTYGDRDHKPIEDTREELAQILQQAHRDGGNVLIPAFAVGRTQEVLFHLAMLRRAGRLPQPLVYLDSPMAIEVSALYLSNLQALDRADLDRLTDQGRTSLLEVLEFIRPSRSTEDSMALNRIHGGAVIVAGSGMCTGGRIRHHLKHNLWRRETRLVIVGFQAQGTLGRRIVDGAERVNILGEEIAVRAQVHTLGGYSAHAGRSQLLDWAGRVGGDPAFFLVHGEQPALEALAQGLRERLGAKVTIPTPGQSVPLR